MVDFGLVNWDTVEFQNRNDDSNRKRDEFIKLNNGSNVVRIVTKPFQYIHHKWKAEGDKGYGKKIGCSMFHGSCPLCEKGNPQKRRWYVGVIDRKTQSYKILDMSPAIFRQIQKYQRNEAWGDPGQYDLDITVDKNAGATGYYTVMPMPKVPLSDRDVEIKQKEVDAESLKRRCTPPKPEDVLKQMSKMTEQNASTGAVTETDDDDVDYEFPPAKVAS